jgi:hypothetical protein
MNRAHFTALGAVMAMFLSGCGGGSSSRGSSSPPPSAPLTIVTPSILPGSLTNHPYSTTLTAINGQGALKWSIAPFSQTELFVEGLTIDPGTGVLSGTPTFSGTAGFKAQVVDASSHTASQDFTVTGSSPLQPGQPLSFAAVQYGNVAYLDLSPLGNGGVEPKSYSLSNGCLPLGFRVDNAYQRIVGSPLTIGTYGCTVTIQDSYTPPEAVSNSITITVNPPNLTVTDSLPKNGVLNRPYTGRVIATGGIRPYHFALATGSVLPAGLGPIDAASGGISGTPTAAGSAFTVNTTDSSSPPQSASNSFYIDLISAPLGRNDTIATATPITNGWNSASISPYIDPPVNVPFAADGDYYKLVSVVGSTVHLETQAQRWHGENVLDTVIEVLDANNNRYSSCRQPSDTGTKFAALCINDDIGGSPPTIDSALDFQVPGTPSTATTFFVHVLDWRGDARPDMTYGLQVSGVVAPLTVQSTSIPPAARGLSYSQQLTSANGVGNVSWAITSGALPPGLSLDSSGVISGTATTDGNYSLTLQASDSETPPQKATAQESIQVAEPIKIASSPTFPDACVNQFYSFPIQTSGGVPPLVWSFYSPNWVAIGLNQSTGVFSGTADVIGTFSGTVSAGDATGHFDSQQVSLTVKQCP